ncbi:TonB-dependent receptor domain-containing protein [Flavobacterium pedocola]
MKSQLVLTLSTFLITAFAYSQEENKENKEKSLEEIVVTVNPKTFVTKNGNIKLDVANSIFNAVPNTLDLLSKLPKIQISPNRESLSVIGKGSPLVYIDNQKVEINDLNTLNVADIKSVEIINNPSSKYEADGRAVILITRKLTKKEGFKVDIVETASFKKYFNNYFGVNSSIKNKKTEYKANFNYNQLKMWESNGNDFMIPDKEIISNYLTKAVTKRPQFVYGGGVFYKINEDDYFSFNFNARTHKDKFDITTTTYNKDLDSEDNIKTANENDENRRFHNAFVNYNHKIKSIDGVVFTGLQYSNFNQKTKSIIADNYNDSGFEVVQNRNQEFTIEVISGRADFEKTFKNQMKLELGTLYLQANADTDFFAENINPQSTTVSKYTYKEKNSSGYSQLSGSIKKLTYTVGLRVENTVVKGRYGAGDGLPIDKEYTNFFPKAKFEIPIDSTKTVTFNYAKSISRPNFSTTSQISSYINPYLVFSNNINLDPTITDEAMVNFQYRDKSLSISYNKKTNPVYYSATYDETQNLLTFKPANFEKASGFNVEFSLPFSYKSWTTTNVLSVSWNKIEDQSAVLQDSKPYLYYYSNHSFKLPKDIELAVTGWGLTRQREGVFQNKAVFTTDLALSKTFFKHFDCTLSYNDIFKKLKYYDSYTANSISTKGKYFTDAHMISVSVKYFFGKIKNSEFQERNIDENTNRIR